MFAPMADTTERPPLTVEEAAERLSLSRRQVYYLLDSGEIPSLRYPGRTEDSPGIRRIEAHELDAFIERSRQAAAS
jgi:excisionase family DNA binding protein